MDELGTAEKGPVSLDKGGLDHTLLGLGTPWPVGDLKLVPAETLRSRKLKFKKYGLKGRK